MKKQYIFIFGDIHGEWGDFNISLNKIKSNKDIIRDIKENIEVEILIFVCGDFGFFPNYDGCKGFSGKNIWYQWNIKNEMNGVLNNHIKIIWCAGNHENHDVLDELEDINKEDFIEINKEKAPFIYYAKFGSIYTLLDNKKVMFCGGAESIDKIFRVPGDTWWAGETISFKDMNNLPEKQKIDWIISHTCPTRFDKYLSMKVYENSKDPSKMYLDYILDDYSPDEWFFGHYHLHTKNSVNNCKFTCYSYIKSNAKYFDLAGIIQTN